MATCATAVVNYERCGHKKSLKIACTHHVRVPNACPVSKQVAILTTISQRRCKDCYQVAWEAQASTRSTGWDDQRKSVDADPGIPRRERSRRLRQLGSKQDAELSRWEEIRQWQLSVREDEERWTQKWGAMLLRMHRGTDEQKQEAEDLFPKLMEAKPEDLRVQE